MAIMKFKNSNGEWMGIPAFKGEPGKDGAIQYKAGDGIKIENDTITAEVTKDYLDGKLEELGGMGFTPEITESLPTENIDEKTIYMVPSENGNGDNVYEEWMYINNKWEMIGSTSVDLTNYYTKDESIKTFVIERKFAPNDGQRTYSTIPDAELEVCNKMIECAIKGEPFVVYFKNLYENSDTPSTFVYKYTTGYEQGDNYFQIKFYDFVGLRKTDVWYRITVDTTTNQVVTSGTKLLVQTTEDRLGDITGHTNVSGMWTFNNPTNDYQPATKKYVDNAVASMEAPESNIVSIDISGFRQTAFSSGTGTGYASSNESVKAGLEKIARLGARVSIIHLYNSYSSMICVYSNSYNHSDGGWGAYYTGSYQTNSLNVNGTKATVTTKYAADGTPQNIQVSFDSTDGFVIKDNVLVKNNTTAFEPTANYHPATKKYVDDALANIPQGSGDAKGFYTYKVDLGNIGFAGEIDDYGWITHMVTDKCKTEINDLINKMLTGNIGQPLVVIENTNAEADLKSMLLFGFDTEYDPATMQSLDFTLHGVANYIGSATGSLMMKYENAVMFAGSGIVTDGVWDATALAIAVTTQQSLTTDNTWEYTPTGDYNPATKKYVDDAVANAGGEVVGSPIFNIEFGYFQDNVTLIPSTGSRGIPDFIEMYEYCLKNNIKYATIYAWIQNDTSYKGIFNLEITNNPSNRYINMWFRDPQSVYKGFFYSFALTRNSETGVYRVAGANSPYRFNYLYLRLDKASTVTAEQTFNVLPVSNVVPTKDTQLTNKKYVDDAVAGASGGITSETDPVFSKSEAAKITSTDTANWNSKVDINAVNNAINTTLSSKSYLTSESDPTVPSWAKQPNKPTYTASEVGALPASTVIPTVPSKLSGFTDDLGSSPKHTHSQYLTAHQDISGKQNKVLYGIADPTSDIGAEGDIYIKYV